MKLNINSEKKFEEQFANELNLEYGMTFQREFTLYDPVSKSNSRIDFYIRGPIRAIVEIRFGNTNIDQLINYSNLAKNLFGGAVEIFFITPNKIKINEKKQINIFNKNINWILIPENEINPARYCFDIINKFILMKTTKLDKKLKIEHVYPLSKDGFAPIKIINRDENYQISPNESLVKISKPKLKHGDLKKLGPLEDHLINLKHLIKLSEYEKIENEFEEFIKEYEQEHYTSCALRVGRSLELMVLSLAQAWDVRINVKVLKIINELKNEFNKLNQLMVDLSYIEKERIERQEKSIEKQMDVIQQTFNEYQRNVFSEKDKLEFFQPSTAPLNIHAVMKDIKNKFNHNNHKNIKKELKKIEDANLISNLLEKRNLAAHLDTSGKKREFDKEGIDEMLKTLGYLIHLFNNVADNIRRKE